MRHSDFNPRIGKSSNTIIRENAAQLRLAKTRLRAAEEAAHRLDNFVAAGYEVNAVSIAEAVLEAEIAAVQYRRALKTFLGEP